MQRKWRVTLIVVAGVFMASLDLFIVNIAFPEIAKDYDGVSLPALSWVLNAYAIVFAALLVPAGRWADAFGRRRIFLTGLVVFALASLACALAPASRCSSPPASSRRAAARCCCPRRSG